MTDRRILFQGELQLMRWSESSTNGATVTFWVHPDDLESFKAIKARAGKHAGQRIAAVMMEIADDEAVAEQAAPEVTPEAKPAPRPRASTPPLTLLAVRWCQSPVFLKWAEHEWGTILPLDEEGAKRLILSATGLSEKHGEAASRKHLDADPEAAALFHEYFRIPFTAYLRDNLLEP